MKLGLAIFLILAATSLLQIASKSYSRDELRKIQDGLILLSSEILKNDNVLLIAEKNSMLTLGMDRILKDGFGHTVSYSVLDLQKLQMIEEYPNEFIRGAYMKTILLFSSDPTEILDRMADFETFNSDYLILVCIDSSLDLDSVVRHGVVQRSKYITTIQPELKKGNNLSISYVLHTNYLNYTDSKIEKYIGTIGSKELTNADEIFKSDYLKLDGVHLRLASFCDDFPFLYTQGVTFTNIDPLFVHHCEGSNLDIFDILAKNLNFTYDYQMYSPDWRWGSMENGTWVGMLGQLYRREKDIMINNIMLTEERHQAFDASVPYLEEGFGIIVRDPPDAPKWRGILYPFSLIVWIYLLIASIIVALMWSIGLCTLSNDQDVTRVFLQIFSGLTRVSYDEKFSRSWNHQIALMWWLVGFVVSSAYTCNLIAFLTVSIPTKRIETINELSKSHLKLMMHDYGEFVPEALKSSIDPALSKLGNNMDTFPEYSDYLAVGFPSVIDYTHALVNGESFITFMLDIANVSDKTYIMKEVLYPNYLVYYWPKNTPQRDVISEKLQRLFEGHIIRTEFNKHLQTRVNNRKKFDNLEEAVLGLEHLTGAFVLLLSGYLLSLIAFLIELAFRRKGMNQ